MWFINLLKLNLSTFNIKNQLLLPGIALDLKLFCWIWLHQKFDCCIPSGVYNV